MILLVLHNNNNNNNMENKLLVTLCTILSNERDRREVCSFHLMIHHGNEHKN